MAKASHASPGLPAPFLDLFPPVLRRPRSGRAFLFTAVTLLATPPAFLLSQTCPPLPKVTSLSVSQPYSQSSLQGTPLSVPPQPRRNILTWTLDASTPPDAIQGFEVFRYGENRLGCDLPETDTVPRETQPFAILRDPTARSWADDIWLDTTEYSYEVVPFSANRGCRPSEPPIQPLNRPKAEECPESGLPPLLTMGEHSCSGQSLQASSTEPCSSWAWIRDDALLALTTNPEFYADRPGTYRVRCINEACLPASASATITSLDPPPTATATMQDGSTSGTTICEGEKIFVYTDRSATFQWHIDGEPIHGATSSHYEPWRSGSYSCLVTDVASLSFSRPCTTMSNSLDITVLPVPNLRIRLESTDCDTAVFRVAGFGGTTRGATNIRWYKTSFPLIQERLCTDIYNEHEIDCGPGGDDLCTVAGNGSPFWLTARYRSLPEDLSAESVPFCCNQTASLRSVIGMPEPTIVPLVDLIGCDEIEMRIAGSSTYRGVDWLYRTSSEPFADLPTDSALLQATATGDYMAIVTGANGCTKTTPTVHVSITGQPTASAAPTIFGYPSDSCPSGTCPIISVSATNIALDAELRVRFEVIDDYASATGPNFVDYLYSPNGQKDFELIPVTPPSPDSGSGPAVLNIPMPVFGRDVVARIVLTQDDCLPTVALSDGKPSLFVAVAPDHVIAVPRRGTAFGGNRLRLFGYGIGNSPSAVSIGAYSADFEAASSPDELFVYPHASPVTTDPWKNVVVHLSDGSVRTGSRNYRYVNFGVVTLEPSDPSLGTKVGSYFFDAGDLGEADWLAFGSRLIDSDPYVPGVQPIFLAEAGIIGVVFGRQEAAGLERNRSWVYVASQERIVRYDLADNTVDVAFGDLEGLPPLDGLSANLPKPLPPFCPPITILRALRFHAIASDGRGRIAALVTLRGEQYPEGSCGESFWVRSLQIWSESQPLSSIESVYELEPYAVASTYWGDKLWMSPSDASGTGFPRDFALTYLRRVSDSSWNFGTKGLAWDPSCVPPCEPATEVFSVEQPVADQGTLFSNWPSSALFGVPTDSSCNLGSVLGLFDPNTHYFRQLLFPSGALRTGAKFQSHQAGYLQQAAISSQTDSGQFDTRLLFLFGDLSNDGVVRKLTLEPCGEITTLRTEEYGPTNLGTPNPIRGFALWDDGRHAIAWVTDSNSLVPFDAKTLLPQCAPDSGTLPWSVPFPGRPLAVALQPKVLPTSFAAAAVTAAEKLPDAAWAALERRDQIRSDLGLLSEKTKEKEPSANAIIGLAESTAAKISRWVIDKRGQSLLRDYMTGVIDSMKGRDSKGAIIVHPDEIPAQCSNF